MAKVYLMYIVVALVLVHVTARNVPSTTTAPNNVGLNHDQNNVKNIPKATAPSGDGLDDQKNFLMYGGVGGFGGVGGYSGVLPIGGIGGLGSAGGLGGASGLGGLGSLGGIGGGVGGAGGVGGILP